MFWPQPGHGQQSPKSSAFLPEVIQKRKGVFADQGVHEQAYFSPTAGIAARALVAENFITRAAGGEQHARVRIQKKQGSFKVGNHMWYFDLNPNKFEHLSGPTCGFLKWYNFLRKATILEPNGISATRQTKRTQIFSFWARRTRMKILPCAQSKRPSSTMICTEDQVETP